MNEPILKVENMNKKFGSTIALNNVSLTVYPGEIRGLIGENGSGSLQPVKYHYRRDRQERRKSDTEDQRKIK